MEEKKKRKKKYILLFDNLLLQNVLDVQQTIMKHEMLSD